MKVVFLAAGMGRRFGGVKQVAAVGPHGETILDYSMFDASRAGFSHAIFVIREEIRPLFERWLGRRSACGLDVSFALQREDDVPASFTSLAQRRKPWGTGHAVLAARELIDGPFAVANADDFYGQEAWEQVFRILSSLSSGRRGAMIGYRLSDTVPDRGHVSRGLCDVVDDRLRGIREGRDLRRTDSGIVTDGGSVLDPRLPVSMNLWAFSHEVVPRLAEHFEAFLHRCEGDAEFLLPNVVGALVSSEQWMVDVITAGCTWCGITHAGDAESVSVHIRSLIEAGAYPEKIQ